MMLGSAKLVLIWSIATLVLRTRAANGKTTSAGGLPATIQLSETLSTTLTLPMLLLLARQQLAKSRRRRRRLHRNALWCAAAEQTAVLALSRPCVRGAARPAPALSLLATCIRSRLAGARTGAPRKTAALFAHSSPPAPRARQKLAAGGATLR